MTTDTPRVLVVDDDVDMVEVYRHILTRGGYRVTACYSPAEALRALESETPNAIVTDLMMDTLDSGFAFAKAVKEDPRFAHIPIVIITAAGTQRGFDFRPRTDADFAAMKVDAFLDKPVQSGALLKEVSRLLGTA